MSLQLFTIDDKLEAIEHVIVATRRALGSGGNSDEAKRYEVLKAIAADLRGRKALEGGTALAFVQRSLDQVKKSKTGLGYETGSLIALSNNIIKMWPAISQALEHAEKETFNVD